MDTNRSRDVWLTVLFVLLLMAGLAVFALGVYLAIVRGEFIMLGIGLLAVTLPAAIYALAGRGGVDPVMAKNMADQTELLRQMNERLLISDQAKRIAFRQNDREALRKAILEDVRQEDYDAALALVKEMAETFGYREEAEQFRQQILENQNRKREAVVQRAIATLDDVLKRHDWERARYEVGRLRRIYPDYPGINELPARVDRAREAHKAELERRFLEAWQRDDVEHGKELLKELDRYLTPQEAEPFMEIARGVVGKWKDNLGARFKMAVADRDWIEALTIGEQITREFPNSQFAREVRDMIDNLRTRAAGQRAAMAEGQSV